MAIPRIETRRTGEFAFGHYGIRAYRIWQQFDGRRWFQRHEWIRNDGSSEFDNWIDGHKAWASDAQPVEDAV